MLFNCSPPKKVVAIGGNKTLSSIKKPQRPNFGFRFEPWKPKFANVDNNFHSFEPSIFY